MTTNTNEHVIAINLSQVGVRGDINMNTSITGPDSKGPLPEVYGLAGYLVQVARQLVDDVEPRINEENGTLYTATFEVRQPADEEVFYSRAHFDPKVERVGGKFADVHAIINTVAQVYLDSIGMLDEDGNIVAEGEELDRIELDTFTDKPTLH